MLDEYAKKVLVCNENHVPTQQFFRHLVLLKNQHNKDSLETILIPKMSSLLPFSASAVSFSDTVFKKLLYGLENYENASFICDFNLKFLENLANKFQDVTKNKYHNIEIFSNCFPERISFIKNDEQRNLEYEKLNKLWTNLKNKSITCEDVNFVDNNLMSLNISMKYNKLDLQSDLKETYKKTQTDCLDKYDFQSFKKLSAVDLSH